MVVDVDTSWSKITFLLLLNISHLLTTHTRPANDYKMNYLAWPWEVISWQNAFSASTSWIRAFECQK